jgi:hypothetical protein
MRPVSLTAKRRCHLRYDGKPRRHSGRSVESHGYHLHRPHEGMRKRRLGAEWESHLQ